MSAHSFVLYRSETSLTPKSDVTRAMIGSARRSNLEQSLTGFLHHDDGIFFHWLEGDGDSLSLTMERIGRDPRHRNLATLASGPLPQRRFPDCPMGYSTQSDYSLLRWMADHAVTVREQSAYALALLSFLEERAGAPGHCQTGGQPSRSIWRAKASM